MTSKKPIFIVGPCVVEDFQIMRHIAETIKNISCEYNVTIYYKSSFDKANRTSIHSYRGPGIEKGLDVLKRIKEEYNLPIITDIHEPFQAEMVAKVVDIIQIPALLCRQTDLIVAAACTGKIVNLKKGQYMSGEDMKYPIDKARVSGAEYVYVTERGNMFGYNDIVVDFRNIAIMKGFAEKVIMDCTHSVQQPNSENGVSGGNPQYIASMAKAAKAFGADGYFFEVHPIPEKALCDGHCMLSLDRLEKIIKELV